MLIDLQVHSNYSDGYLTPTEMVKFLARQGVKVASLTDHNTVGGLEEFKKACQKEKIKSIVGLELYAKLGSAHFNVLWYNFDPENPLLHNMLRKSHIRRRQQMRRILDKLVRRGFKIDVENILDRYNRYVPINQIIDRIMEKKENVRKVKKELGISSPREEDVINKYFRNPKVGVLRESYIDLEKILELKKQIGGQVILCHPAKYGYIRRELWLKLKKMGVDGTEVLSPHHSINGILYMQQLARELDFIVTGGSDFHKPEGGGQPLQYSWQYYKIDSHLLRNVRKIIG
jgi:3',5'-nucleoside bisphosphate phosphatase